MRILLNRKRRKNVWRWWAETRKEPAVYLDLNFSLPAPNLTDSFSSRISHSPASQNPLIENEFLLSIFSIQHISRSRFLFAEHRFTVIAVVCESKWGRYGFRESSRRVLRVHSISICIPSNSKASTLSACESWLSRLPQPEALCVAEQLVRWSQSRENSEESNGSERYGRDLSFVRWSF